MEVLQTKLHAPAVTPDLVRRDRLYERLDRGFDGDLTLISAPAGYGKSTLLAGWAESRAEPRAWLSLDSTDCDVVNFCSHLVAGIRSFAPHACVQTEALLEAPEQPPLPVIARCLANDLDTIDTAFIVALDDYQALGSSASNELVDALLRHPPRRLHLVISTRRDPPLSLASLRAAGRLTDVRLRDLAFTGPETAAFLRQAEGVSPDDRSLAHLQELVEGWGAGLRLTCLVLRHYEDPDGFLCALQGDLTSVHEYLAKEVLGWQSPAMQRWLIET